MDYTEWLEIAVDKIKTLPINTTFVLKDLFDGIKWGELDRGDKSSFGKYFKNAVIDNDIPNVVYSGKAGNNSSQYEKIA